MIPKTGMTQEEFDEIIQRIEGKKHNSKDYKLSEDGTRIEGMCDGLDEVAQTLYLIVNTERYKYNTMSSDTGVELEDKYGEDLNLVEMAVINTIKEAFLNDDRVEEVTDATVERVKRGTFRVNLETLTSEGKTGIEEEVNIGGI